MPLRVFGISSDDGLIQYRWERMCDWFQSSRVPWALLLCVFTLFDFGPLPSNGSGTPTHFEFFVRVCFFFGYRVARPLFWIALLFTAKLTHTPRMAVLVRTVACRRLVHCVAIVLPVALLMVRLVSVFGFGSDASSFSHNMNPLIHPTMQAASAMLVALPVRDMLASRIFSMIGYTALWIQEMKPGDGYKQRGEGLRFIAFFILVMVVYFRNDAVEAELFTSHQKLRKTTAFIAHESRNQIFAVSSVLQVMEQTSNVQDALFSL
jgi:hypothetical protein